MASQAALRISLPRRIFKNQRELRAGWRLLIFVALSFFFGQALTWVLRRIHLQHRPFIDPVGLFNDELFSRVPVLLATLIMAGIERQRLSDYGIPVRNAFGRDFWVGNAWGLGTVSVLISLIALGGGYKVLGLVVGGKLLVYYLVLWLLASAMIGFSEEIIFRGYLLATLASGIGFWAASVLLSIGFGALHYFLKPYERWEDFASTGLIGLFVCFALRRTGSLAFSIGFHLAFDFGAIFVYSGRNAGEFAIGRLLRTS